MNIYNLLTLLFLLILSSCSIQEKDPKINLINKVHSEKVYEEEIDYWETKYFNENKQLFRLEEDVADDGLRKLNYVEEYTYNDEDFLIQKDFMDADGFWWVTNYFYENDKLLRKKTSFTDPNNDSETKFEYQNNKLVKEIKNQWGHERITSFYYNKKNLLEEKYESTGNGTFRKWTYFYDENNRKIKELLVSDQKIMKVKIIEKYNYDSLGRMIADSSYNLNIKDEKTTMNTPNHYYFNKNDSLIKKVGFFTRSYKYVYMKSQNNNNPKNASR